MRYITRSFLFLFLMLSVDLFAQLNNVTDVTLLDTSSFANSSNHWYNIKDTDKVIEPIPGQMRYAPTDYLNIAGNILLYQKENGGWPKNYDMQAVLTASQKSLLSESRKQTNTGFDNGATYSHLNYLAAVYSLTHDAKFKTAFINGIEYILSAQYPNGGWPQFYPDLSSYRHFITFNDGAMAGIMKLLKRIVDKENDFLLVDNLLYEKVEIAFNLGIDCILNTQIKENGKLLIWCQQHDEVTLQPVSARTFEPAALCNGESAGIVEILMSIKNPNPRIIQSVEAAVKWFNETIQYGIRVTRVSAPIVEFQYRTSNNDRIIEHDSTARPIWARYHELNTHKIIFCNRDGNIVYKFEDIERERRSGYSWYIYDPQDILNMYPEWKKKINEK